MRNELETKGAAIEQFRTWLKQAIWSVEAVQEHLADGDVAAAQSALHTLWTQLHRQHQS
jgi:hypothetical protein